MKPLYTKKNGISQRMAAIEVKMPASYPSAKVTYGSGSVEDALDGIGTKLTQVDTVKGTLTPVNYTSDLYPLSLENGSYTISNVSTSFVPYPWGVLVVMGSANYGVCFFIATVGNTYSRCFSELNNSWYTEWKQL